MTLQTEGQDLYQKQIARPEFQSAERVMYLSRQKTGAMFMAYSKFPGFLKASRGNTEKNNTLTNELHTQMPE